MSWAGNSIYAIPRPNRSSDSRIQWHNRRKSAWSGSITAKTIRAQFNRQSRRCWYCEEKLSLKRGFRQAPKAKTGKSAWRRYYFHIEHREPASRGGSNAKYNIVIACERCNLDKGTMTEDEFRSKLQKPLREHFEGRTILRKKGEPRAESLETPLGAQAPASDLFVVADTSGHVGKP